MNSKAKGGRGERELAAFLNEHGFAARRGQQFKGGEDSPDVICFPDLHIECKRVEKLNVYKAMSQALRDCGHKIATVWHRRNREEWLVTLRAEDFISIYKRGLKD